MSVTLKDISLKAGVSVATVSHIVNNRGDLYAELTRKKVLQVAEDLGYKPNLLALGLRGLPTKQIGLIVPEFFKETHQIEQLATARGYSVVMLAHHADPVIFEDVIKKCVTYSFDGIGIMKPVMTKMDILPKLMPKTPVVILGDDSIEGYDNFIVPLAESTQLATEYLLGLGHQKIGFICNQNRKMPSIDARYKGYEAAVKEHGVWDPAYEISLPDEGNPMERGYHAFKKFFSQCEKSKTPTALVTSNDEVALGVMVAAEEFALKIPEDLSLVGILNLAISLYGRVPLTTVDCNYHGRSVEMMARLLERIKHPDLDTKCFRENPSMVIRQSCRELN